MPQPNPHEYVQQQAVSRAIRFWNWLTDHLHAWASGKLVLWISGAVGAATAAAFVLPFLVALVFGVSAIGLMAWAVGAHHLLHRERRINEWNAVQRLRSKQREIRAQIAIREAAVLIADEPGRDFRPRARAYPPLVAAVRYSKGRIRQARQAEMPPQQRQRQPAVPKKPDLGDTRRELKSLEAEAEAVEAQIQALAAPDAKREASAKEKKEAYRRIKDADVEARRRVRKGMSPTAPEGAPGIEVTLKLDGSRKVDQRPPRETPEQIADDDPPASPTA